MREAGALIPLLAALVLGLAPRPAQDAGKRSAGSASEKQLLSAFNKGFSEHDASKRAAAVTTLGEQTLQLPDKGASKAVAQALTKGLEDDDLDVRDAAIKQLCFGRDVDTVLAGLDKSLRDERTQIERQLKNTDKDSRDYVTRGSVLFGNGCFVLATYRDDRAVTTLTALLSGLRANTEGNDVSTRLIDALATSALALGTLDAVTAAVKQTQTFTGRLQEPAAHALHDALAEFARGAGAPGPEWSEHAPAAWQDWLEANKAKFPNKLGVLKAPPADGPVRGLDGMPGKSGG